MTLTILVFKDYFPLLLVGLLVLFKVIVSSSISLFFNFSMKSFFSFSIIVKEKWFVTYVSFNTILVVRMPG